MSVQITVRLPDDLVAFLDEEVHRGAVRSRADAVTRALTRERRRTAALADVAILRGSGPDDLDELAGYTSAHPVELGD